MARIRTIKPDFWTDEKVVELDMSARLFFIGSWNFADDNGNLQRSAKKLKMQIFPADAIDCEPIIHSLIAHGLLSEYTVNGEKFLHINGFRKHQVINRPSKTGLPTPESVLDHGALTEDSLTEGNGREEERNNNPPNPPSPVGDEGDENATSCKQIRTRKSRVALKTFLAECREKGIKPVTSYRPLMEYVEKVALPHEFLELAWDTFRREHGDGGANERRLQADWQRHFCNYVTKGYYRLWVCKPDGSFELTTLGQQSRKFLEAA